MYRQLTLSQRLTIQELLEKGVSRSEIARRLKVHRSTIKREIDRNSLDGVYRAEDAQSVSLYRKRMAGSIALLKQYPNYKPYRNYSPFPPSPIHKKRKKKNFRFKPKRDQYRYLRYQEYIPRKDPRFYDEHPNKRRSFYYPKWKSKHESRYRFRDNTLAESRRRRRWREDFLRYYSNPTAPGLKYAMRMKRALRKLARQEYEIRCWKIELRMMKFEQRLSDMRILAVWRRVFMKIEQDNTNRRIRLLLALLLIFHAYELHVLLSAGKARPPT